MISKFVIICVLLFICIQFQGSFSQQCPQIPRRARVRSSCTNQNNRNSRCTFSCSNGYQLQRSVSNSRRRTCRCFGAQCVWTGSPAVCIRARQTAATRITSTTTTQSTPATTVAYSCLPPHFSKQHFARVIDEWPTGAILRIRIKKQNLVTVNGWSVIIRFKKNLPSNITVLSWTSKLVSAKGKDLILSNVDFNAKLSDTDRFTFVVVLLGTSKQEMLNNEASVGFYNEQITNLSCFNLTSDRNQQTVTQLSTTVSSTLSNITSTHALTTGPRRTTTRRPPPTTTTRAPPTTRSVGVTTSSRISAGIDVDSVRINDVAVRRHRQGCNVLMNALSVEHPSYSSPDGKNTFQFNANVVISGSRNRMNGWTLKIVFSKPIINIKVWEAKFARRSKDRRAYILQPLSWNSNLQNDYSFQIIPEMRTRPIPKTVMYLCPKRISPNLNGNGIFITIPGVNSTRTPTTPRSTTRSTTPRSTTRSATRSTTTVRPTRPTKTTRRPRRPNRNRAQCRQPAGRLPRRRGQTRVRYTRSPPNERRPYDYNQVLAMSILFYEAQRSGKLPANNRIPWRGDSGLRDGCDVGYDLTGGLYDAGDHVKFGFPMAWTVTVLAWGVIEFKEAYVAANEFNNMLSLLKWVTDYFIKAHTAKYEFYGQVGTGKVDHDNWGRPEEMRMTRRSYKIDRNHPGTDLAAETAAALAATSVVFRDNDASYADLLVHHAKELYEFADRYRGSYHQSIRDAFKYYRSYSGYEDELVWGALWLYKATGQNSYLQMAIRKYRSIGGGGTARVFSWDDKRAGFQVLLANFTGQTQYKNHVAAYQRFLRRVPKTPRGMTYLSQWGSSRYAANGAFIALAAAKIPGMPNKQEYIRYARSQINFLLGSSGRSFVVGYGRNSPNTPHHRSSSCPAPPRPCTWGNAFHNRGRNPYILYGALIGGPYLNGSFVNDRTNYVSNEVAIDYNAGFQGAVAGLKFYQIQNRRS